MLTSILEVVLLLTRKIQHQHGGDWERSRPQALPSPRTEKCPQLFNDCDLWAEHAGMELKCYWFLKLFLTWLLPDILRYDSPKQCPTILYAVNLWLKQFQLAVSAARAKLGVQLMIREETKKRERDWNIFKGVDPINAILKTPWRHRWAACTKLVGQKYYFNFLINVR